MEVNKHLSLILNGLKAMGYPMEAVRALSEHSRDKALDALCRIVPMNHYFDWGCSDSASVSVGAFTVHSADEDSSKLLPHVKVPINVYRNQLVFDPDRSEYLCEQPHRGFERHLIPVGVGLLSDLVVTLGEYLKPSVINGVKIPEVYLSSFQHQCLENFASFRTCHSSQGC